MTSATQVLSARAASTDRPHARTTHLPGVDGIRALAVSAVVLYHLNGNWLPGGYLGVDVFFVVSGYLITRLLVADRGATGQIGLQNFWIRRARRILPPLFPMLLVTVLGTALVDRSMLHDLRTEVFGALTYTSNWVQISQHNSYFAKFDAPSSLQHLWSLAVEEQFYLVWPLVVAAMLLWWGRRRLAVIAGLGALGSAAAMAALYQPGTDPSHIYYSTLTHSAGLLVGAVLAIAWPATNAPNTPRAIKVSTALSVLGVVGIGIGFWLLDEHGAAPYQGGIFAVSVASALLIVGAGHGQTAIGRFLSRPLARWLGARSYGLYLWHWPVLVLGDRVFGHRGLVVIAVEVTISVLLAAASYRWIERPVQRYGYGGAYALAKQSVLRGGKRPHRAAMLGAAALAAACVFAAISLVTAPPPPSSALEDQLASAQVALQRASLTTARPLSVPAQPVAAGASTPCPSAPPPGDQITALGDSVMLAASPSLLTALPGIEIDAQTNRSMQAGSDILAARARDGTLRPVVLLGLGTNGVFPRAMLDGIIDQLGPNRTVYLVNLYLTTKPYTSEINDTLAAVAKARSNVHLADWQVTAAGHTDTLYSDGIHPKPGPGSDLYANMVVSLMSGLPCHERTHRIVRPISMASAEVPVVGPRPSASGHRTHAISNLEPNAAQPTALAVLEDIGTFRVPMSIVLVMLLVPLFIRMRPDETLRIGDSGAAMSSRGS